MPPNVGVGIGIGVGGRPDAQAMLAQQNREMEALERRSQRERSASMNPVPVRRVSAVTLPIRMTGSYAEASATAATAPAARRGRLG
jgi:hypothetical protein